LLRSSKKKDFSPNEDMIVNEGNGQIYLTHRAVAADLKERNSKRRKNSDPLVKA
jgi:hypothetical protein